MVIDKPELSFIHITNHQTFLKGNSSVVRAIAEDLAHIKDCSCDIIIDHFCSGIEDKDMKGINA